MPPRPGCSDARATEDGFVIAEEDLKLRGGGEVLGTRQSGLPVFRVARLPEDEALLQVARDGARLALARDPELKSERSENLRLLLYLFERDDAIKLIRAGWNASPARRSPGLTGRSSNHRPH